MGTHKAKSKCSGHQGAMTPEKKPTAFYPPSNGRSHGIQVSPPHGPQIRTEPKVNCTNHNVRRVLPLVRQALRPIPAQLAQLDRDHQRRGPKQVVHGCAADEFESDEHEQPHVRVPCPACDGVANIGRPHKDEDGNMPREA